MGLIVNPAATGFEKITNNRFYVDKTEIISITNSTIGTEDCLICSTRPRRFGKTYAINTLAAYYSKGASSRALFEEFRIREDPGFDRYLNKLNVIRLNMLSYERLSGDRTNPLDKLQGKAIAELRTEFPGIVSDTTTGLATALEEIHSATGETFYFLIDEWDQFFRSLSPDRRLQEDYLNFLSQIFKGEAAAETVAGAYMTGILPIRKYGTQSSLNNFKEYTMLSPGPMAGLMAFSESEARLLCHQTMMDYNEMRKWYDGYQIGYARHMYSPSSVIQAVSNKEFECYWKNTDTYEALSVYIDMDFDGLREALVYLLGGKALRIKPDSSLNDWRRPRTKDQVLTLLIHLGYLSYDRSAHSISIPNEEVRSAFVDALELSSRTEHWQRQ